MARFEDLQSERLPPSLNTPMARAGGGKTLGPQPGVPLVPKEWGGSPGSFDYSNPPPLPLPIKPYGERLGQLPEGYGFERAQAVPEQLPSGHSFERPMRRPRPLDNPDIQVLDQMQRNQPGMPSGADREALRALIEQYGFANPPR